MGRPVTEPLQEICRRGLNVADLLKLRHTHVAGPAQMLHQQLFVGIIHATIRIEIVRTSLAGRTGPEALPQHRTIGTVDDSVAIQITRSPANLIEPIGRYHRGGAAVVVQDGLETELELQPPAGATAA